MLINVYAPNEDKPYFFLEIFKKLESLDGKRIFVGDFNLALEPKIDRNHENYSNNDKSAKTIVEYMTETMLTDIWRDRNPNKICFTY